MSKSSSPQATFLRSRIFGKFGLERDKLPQPVLREPPLCNIGT
jgi:hypothetical protein